MRTIRDEHLGIADALEEDEIGLNGQTVSAVVVSQTAVGNVDTSVASRAPAVTSATLASSSLTIVVVGARTRDVIACVGLRANSSIGLEGQTSTAVIMSLAARRNLNAGLLGSAPRESYGACTLSSDTIVAGRTLGRNVIAGVCRSAPSSASLESGTDSTLLTSQTTARNLNAGLFHRAVNVSLFTETSSSLTVVMVGAGGGNIVALIVDRTPASSGLVSQAIAAFIIG